MNKHFDLIEGANWLTKQDRDDFSRYLNVYRLHIELQFGHFSWQDEAFQFFCKKNKISSKGNKSKIKQQNHFWFSTSKPKGKSENDFAHHFMRHIRNAFAHGLIGIKYEGKKKHKYFIMKDFEQHGEQSMSGVIRSDYLWEMIWLLFETRNTK